ncbi:MAG: sel1 repeat family protein [Magnetococcales bacterium]|nr:sel1 repeat family protein [Magnetococcales bacterium]
MNVNATPPTPDALVSSTLLQQSSQESMHTFTEDDYFNTLLTLAEWGDAKAQHNLGALFLEGIEIEQDYTEAFKWHSLAAEQGMAMAQHDLATLYLDGLGVDENPEKAAYWFAEAARQGDSKAQNNLGILYATGHGVPLDLVQAYKWFTLAAEQGMLDALENRAMAEEEMSSTQLAAARQLLSQ